MLLAGLILGLTGGLHCVGMCSPLLGAVAAKSRFKLSMIIYNAGRISMYGFLGVIAASFGAIVRLLYYQELISTLLGGLLIIAGVALVSRVEIPYLTKGVSALVVKMQGMWSGWFKKRGWGALYVLGMLNGLLPCGLTYIAMTYALLADTLMQGWLYMIMFGLGTIPVMQLAPWIFKKILTRVQFRFHRLASLLLIISGALIMGRSLLPHSAQMHQMNAANTTEVLCK